eukprot:UN06351
MYNRFPFVRLAGAALGTALVILTMPILAWPFDLVLFPTACVKAIQSEP